jgi:hypothetical protein
MSFQRFPTMYVVRESTNLVFVRDESHQKTPFVFTFSPSHGHHINTQYHRNTRRYRSWWEKCTGAFSGRGNNHPVVGRQLPTNDCVGTSIWRQRPRSVAPFPVQKWSARVVLLPVERYRTWRDDCVRGLTRGLKTIVCLTCPMIPGGDPEKNQNQKNQCRASFFLSSSSCSSGASTAVSQERYKRRMLLFGSPVGTGCPTMSQQYPFFCGSTTHGH